ncbi:hypothetical protein F0562_023758 [Nyssa sinensis]|uniref:Uncharacterized protein n=1 Tax=Nyssa sinensis TaxID=561372 RepID=A0A5J5BIX7_9ASTE|nr:hypothetical protein F0562_023758 [Nyssa sinensis]
MDADKRLTALKKAYADIILNTAKEAAARIMVSERKSLRFQHELSVAKEEALQMLLRLKQMMDSKISEAEMTSLSQQRKIEEVEAQLQEAEDIVRDLREELREVQAELEKVTNNKVQHHLDECDTTPQEETSEENRLNISQSIIFPAPLSQHESIIASDVKNSTSNLRYEGLKCCSDNDSCMGNSYVHSHYLPSTIMRSKEPDLYRNGCTQRIRAFERNLLDGELSLSRHSDDVKSETREDEGGKGIYMTSTHKADNMFNIENELVLEDKSWCQFPAIKPFRRKRSIRFKKITSSSCRYLLDQVMKRDQPSDPSCFKTHPSPVNNNAQCGKDLYEMAPRSSSDTTEMGMQRECAEATESEAEFVKAGSVQNTIDKDKVLVDKLVLMRQESGTADSSWDQVYRIDVEKVDVPLVNSESKPDRN